MPIIFCASQSLEKIQESTTGSFTLPALAVVGAAIGAAVGYRQYGIGGHRPLFDSAAFLARHLRIVTATYGPSKSGVHTTKALSGGYNVSIIVMSGAGGFTAGTYFHSAVVENINNPIWTSKPPVLVSNQPQPVTLEKGKTMDCRETSVKK